MNTIKYKVGSGWKFLFCDELDNVINKLPEVTMPKIEDILNFAKMKFDKVKVVILGQDPYPEDAHGLAFSCLTRVPVSLKSIFNNLLESKLISEMPKYGDLRPWTGQGIVLLNIALTTEPGKSGVHINLWSKYIDYVISEISNRKDSVHFVLWGSHAQKKKELIDKRHIVLEWCHPVAMSNPSFKKCPHFVLLSNLGIDFDINIHWFTDGSSKGNQFASEGKSKAGYGLLCTKGHVYSEFGKVHGHQTNIRAEGIALIRCMKVASNIPGSHIIYTDSQFWIDMLIKYMPNWKSFDDRKNADICKEISTEFAKFRGCIRFVNSWHKKGISQSEYYSHGNREAEKLAEKGANLEEDKQ